MVLPAGDQGLSLKKKCSPCSANISPKRDAGAGLKVNYSGCLVIPPMKALCQEGSDYENGNMTLVQKWPAILHLQIGLFSIFGNKPLFGRGIRLLKYRM
jgi:hypothetical protein